LGFLVVLDGLSCIFPHQTGIITFSYDIHTIITNCHASETKYIQELAYDRTHAKMGLLAVSAFLTYSVYPLNTSLMQLMFDAYFFSIHMYCSCIFHINFTKIVGSPSSFNYNFAITHYRDPQSGRLSVIAFIIPKMQTTITTFQIK
jgi:hypothetical protein